MEKVWQINDQAFEKMLGWLDRDREVAAQKYEEIRSRLIKILSYRNCRFAEEIADQTFDRAARKIDQLLETYEGNPANLLLGIANKIYLEYQRKPYFEELSDDLVQPQTEEEFNPQYDCLRKCLKSLSREQYQFILEYYAEQKAEKIKKRKNMAENSHLSSNSMYVKAFRLRARLQKCVIDCLASQA